VLLRVPRPAQAIRGNSLTGTWGCCADVGNAKSGATRWEDFLGYTRRTPPIFVPVAKGNSTLCDLSG